MQARQERTLRAALSAFVCTLVTATLHAAAGGGIPHPLVLALALVLGVALCFGLGGRRVTLAHLVLAIGATQGVLHAAFTFGGSATGSSGMAMPVGTAGSAGHVHGHAAADAARALAGSSAMAMPADHDGAMLLAHVIAGIVSVCSLRAGADAVRRVARALALRVGGALTGAVGALVGAAVALAAALAEPAAVPRPRRTAIDLRPARPVALLAARIQGRRGPPLGALAV
ncbi:hypothetical protein [Clavibacter michiganensis]|uniref:Uncharacterized protein n=3 Tax=Clavibacter michiganensis TaxID=28447 RepID=A0A0D5CE85_9MICO|nr:hypothetical protein [Clavibacter michiganensis]AJW77921.1 hypothetical protein VO01_01075 [Clavibacter michiganensis subsp. insidiosus]AWF97086.1 hypothetical protein BEH61_01040 [Clavibacter michiganensis subsp. insidiosus]AWG00155.1 hypothetical protein BEH62_00895 [Clavibacter michiganensis subsp. insidiosus]OQJ58494.1 hypothetical protein B5P21_00205 [Clavibacter michiganensis subsp. insidiosus]RMC86248.1 hypothetical protein CmiCFBP2404_06515 [Clavibacter michiganensis subsp. insidios